MKAYSMTKVNKEVQWSKAKHTGLVKHAGDPGLMPALGDSVLGLRFSVHYE